eukprot:scaffold36766_cov649-Skeletonema_dohrnii-CCMP3373.AAC.2
MNKLRDILRMWSDRIDSGGEQPRTYPSMVPYLKGFIFVSENWRENRYFDGWTVYQRVWRRMGGKKRSRRPMIMQL